MSILTDRMAVTVKIREQDYKLITDFREWIRFENTMIDGSVSQDEKIMKILTLFPILPPTLDDTVQAAMNFYSGPVTIGVQEKQTQEAAEPKIRIYHYDYDADYIYAAFWSQYGIDLQTAVLHWWQFKALFKGLNDSNLIVKIMGYRSMDLSQIKDSEQKRFYRKMKQIYRLPDLRSEEEKETAMIHALSSIF